MVKEVGGDGGQLPQVSGNQQRKMYEAEYKHAADLFSRTLDAHNKSDNPYQKEAFRKVMDQSLHILKDTAAELKRSELSKQNSQIEQDYNAYQKNGSNEAKLKLEHDLDRAKHEF